MIKYYESKIIEAEDTIDKLLKSNMILPDHTSYFKEIDKWLGIKTENYNKFNVYSSMAVSSEPECDSYSTNLVDSTNKNSIFTPNELIKSYKTILNTVNDITSVACVTTRRWKSHKNSTTEEVLTTIEITNTDMETFCESCVQQGNYITASKNPIGIISQSRELMVITSDSEFDPLEFISNTTANNVYVSSNLDSSGYGTHVSSTNQHLLESGNEFGKNKYYDSCDKSSPCCDNCVSYPDGKCLSLTTCNWVNGKVECSIENKCSQRFTSSTNILPDEFYISELDDRQLRMWNKLKESTETTKATTRNKLFVPETHSCMWFDCNPNSLHNPCNKYNKC